MQRNVNLLYRCKCSPAMIELVYPCKSCFLNATLYCGLLSVLLYAAAKLFRRILACFHMNNGVFSSVDMAQAKSN